MRKLLLSLTAAALAATGGVPASANPEAYADQVAFATWMEAGGRTRAFYGAIGVRDVYPGGTETSALVFRGTCRRYEDEGGATSIVCQAGGRLEVVEPDQFEFNPLLEDASLVVKSGGYRHRVRWTGQGPGPQAVGGFSHDDEGYTADAGLFRGAAAKGRVFGHRVVHKTPFAMAFLSEWAVVSSKDPGEGLEVDISPDGRVNVTRRIALD